jgi:hypothetical protein
MPKNRIIYFGILVTAGAALLWIGAVFLATIKDVLIYFGAAGVLMIVMGVILEARKGRASTDSENQG